MRNLILTVALAAAIGGAANAAPNKPSVGSHLIGDYVEARTASVFAGACHFNGELTTTGRDAQMAWHVREGVWNGVALSNVNAMAAVVSGVNLRDEAAPRKSILYIDDRATSVQADALTDALKTKYGKSLGEVVAIKRVPIAFARKGETYRVEAKGIGKLAVDAMPNHACCKMPNLVWYKPMVELKDRRVGYTRESGVKDKSLDLSWFSGGQNTAFYGEFAL